MVCELITLGTGNPLSANVMEFNTRFVYHDVSMEHSRKTQNEYSSPFHLVLFPFIIFFPNGSPFYC